MKNIAARAPKSTLLSRLIPAVAALEVNVALVDEGVAEVWYPDEGSVAEGVMVVREVVVVIPEGAAEPGMIDIDRMPVPLWEVVEPVEMVTAVVTVVVEVRIRLPDVMVEVRVLVTKPSVTVALAWVEGPEVTNVVLAGELTVSGTGAAALVSVVVSVVVSVQVPVMVSVVVVSQGVVVIVTKTETVAVVVAVVVESSPGMSCTLGSSIPALAE